jgi:5-methylthioadenosine/S-adenosylhomocysteine deaminase
MHGGRKGDWLAGNRQEGRFRLPYTNCPKWRTLLNVANQLVWPAYGHGMHGVWVDGRRVLDNCGCTTIDQEKLYTEVQHAGETIVACSGLANKTKWPLI